MTAEKLAELLQARWGKRATVKRISWLRWYHEGLASTSLLPGTILEKATPLGSLPEIVKNLVFLSDQPCARKRFFKSSRA